MSKFFVFATLLLGIAAPSPLPLGISSIDRVYPEVIPGPGFPSLASLGVTSAELYQMPRNPIAPSSPNPASINKRGKQFTPGCAGGEGDTAAVDDVIACFNYLVRTGNNAAVYLENNGQNVVCTSGSAKIAVVDNASHDSTTWNWDLALGVQWIFTFCNTNGRVEGNAWAYGNTDLIVVVGGLL